MAGLCYHLGRGNRSVVDRMKTKLKKTLTSLWTGELVATAMFWLNYFLLMWMDPTVFRRSIFGSRAWVAVTYSLFILSFILVQGSAYWLILIKRIKEPAYGAGVVGKIYKALKIIDLIMLILGIPVIVICHTHAAVTVLSSGLLLFALVEWINYYVWRLSYSYDPSVLIGLIRHGKLKKSKIAKEITEDPE